MKFLLDQNVALRCVALLSEHGHEVQHVRELGMKLAPDPEIVAAAAERGAVVVTFDKGFHGVLARTGRRSPSVVYIRDQGLDAAATADTVHHVVSRHTAELEQGAAITIFRGLERVRLLPLRR